MKKFRFYWPLFVCLGMFFLVGCSTVQSDPAQAVQNYFQALANKDQDSLVNLSCNEWEENALIELDSLTGVTTEIKELVCQETSREGNDSVINCSGGLELNYNGELQMLDLAGRILIARFEDGEWRACGYR